MTVMNAFNFLPGTKQLIYWRGSDYTHLFAANLDGSAERLVFSFPQPVDGWVMSWDAKRIRFAMAGKMWESRVDGTGMHRFLPEFEKPTCCWRWSRDGRLFVFASPDENGFNIWGVTES